MRRGTTPTISITTDIDLTEAKVLFLTFTQDDTVVFEKTKNDLTVSEDGIECVLTQEDTLKFKSGKSVVCQIRGRLSDDKAVASNTMSCSVDRILKDGVI